ncbi:MAG: FAD-dependent thymidylate synthase [bacterium]|nr:FAD-dependent thymidylate synthase [bacterium]
MAVKLKVTLLSNTPDPERAVAAAGRLCYSPSTAAELKEKMTTGEVEKLVRILIKSGHLSTFEHASFTFGIDGISRSCSHQLVRHRLASYSQQSQRYVRFDEGAGFIVPPKIAKDPKSLAIFEEAMVHAQASYDKLVELGEAAGMEKEAIQEDARFVLPNAAETRIVVTMNARELRHFFAVRGCRRAQWEINALAWHMLFLAKEVAPLLFSKAGPTCLHGKCGEGKMCCGEVYTEEEVAEMTEAIVSA